MTESRWLRAYTNLGDTHIGKKDNSKSKKGSR